MTTGNIHLTVGMESMGIFEDEARKMKEEAQAKVEGEQAQEAERRRIRTICAKIS